MNRNQGKNEPVNLLQLQNLIKRDPSCYDEEFKQQLLHFSSSLEIFRLNPAAEASEFGDLVNFLSHVTCLFPAEGKDFPLQIVQLLEDYADVISPELRRNLCRAVMLLRSKDQIPSVRAYELFFKLFRCPDKLLRDTLHAHIVADIKRVNLKRKDQRLNKSLQNFMFTMTSDTNVKAAHKSLQVMVDLYKKGAWRDEKTVNVIANACFSEHMKVKVCGMKFFLGIDDELEYDDDDDVADNDKLIRDVKMSLKVNKTTTKKKKKITKAIAGMHKAGRKEKQKEHFDFSALHLINDPQGMAEKLFTALRKSHDRFEVKMTMMNLLSRLIGVHELLCLNFYPFLQKYMQPKQKEVTSILAFVATASHPYVPPETLSPLLLVLANNFISDRCTPEVMTVGLNTVREICKRCPLAMTESLLGDLIQYKKYKDKGVSMASKALIQLFRQINPALLNRKDRGKEASELMQAGEHSISEYGQTVAMTYVPGVELLSDQEDDDEDNDNDNDNDNKAQKRQHKEDENDNDGWESQDEDDDSSEGEWVDIQHSDNESENVAPMTKEDKEEQIAKAKKISSTRILTPADFAAIKRKMVERAYNGAEGKKKRARLEPETADYGTRETDNIIETNDIEHLYKKSKMNREERIASINDGRADRQKFGSRKEDTRTGGLTNAKKKKTKNYMMLLKSSKVRTKVKQSSLDRKTKQTAAARKQKKRIH